MLNIFVTPVLCVYICVSVELERAGPEHSHLASASLLRIAQHQSTPPAHIHPTSSSTLPSTHPRHPFKRNDKESLCGFFGPRFDFALLARPHPSYPPVSSKPPGLTAERQLRFISVSSRIYSSRTRLFSFNQNFSAHRDSILRSSRATTLPSPPKHHERSCLSADGFL
jgi:hypothetical protein